MSRKGKLPITIPKGVQVTVSRTQIDVKGPKGTLTQNFVEGVSIVVDNDTITVAISEQDKSLNSFHGLYRSLIDNMVKGVSQGFTRTLEMIGVGYRAAVQGNLLDLQVGLSHPLKLKIPEGITVVVDKSTKINLSGANKQQLGQFASLVRKFRPPEPYQGKGIRFEGEFVRKKAGKTASKK